MSGPDARRSVELAEPELMALAKDVETLTPAQWESDSNCAGWKVADVVAHITRNGESVLLAVQRALVADSTPSFGPTMKAREDEMRASGPSGCAEILRREYRELAEIVGGLSDEQLQLTFPHPLGLRTVAWFCKARLNEVTFHSWDLRRSLGADAPLDDTLGSYSLEYMLNNDPPTLFARSSLDTPHQFRLVADGSVWTVNAGGGAPAEANAASVTTVSAPAGWLALAMAGRSRVDRPEFKVSGPEGAADRFAAVFGQPEMVGH